MNRFLATYSLMEKCIISCENAEQLLVMMDWIDSCMNSEKFPGEENVIGARSLLFKSIQKRKDDINGIGDEEEIDLLTAAQIHPE